MKKLMLIGLTVLMLCQAEPPFNTPLMGKTFLAPRSESVNAAREISGWHRFINQYCQDYYGAFYIAPEAKRTFRPERLAEYFFGTDQLFISGSEVTGRNNLTEILADYFGLSTLFQSGVFLNPHIQTELVDFGLYLGWCDCYIRIHVPYVWTGWHFELVEEIAPFIPLPGTYPPLYMDVPAINAPASSFVQAIAGNLAWGQINPGLEFGRIAGKQHKSGFAEAQIAIGWNFVNSPCGHAGFNIRGSIPAGTRSKAIFIFEPIIGNGHHPELGLGFTGHALLWEKDGDQSVQIFTDINMTHLFKSRQRRSFDLINPADPDNNQFLGFGTRYILAKEFDDAGNYTGRSTPTINITTLNCDVSVAIQIDAVLMASYEYRNYTVDFGYNAWLRSEEKISNREAIPNNRFALKGIQNVATGMGLSNATQSTATIYGNLLSDQAIVADLNPPVFFNDNLIDEDSAVTPLSFTHKLFGSFSYAWIDCHDIVVPYFGIGAEFEFEGLNPRHDLKPNKIAISQWGVWAKTGFGF